MSEFLPPQRLPWVDGQGLALRAIYTWAEGVSRAIGTPPDVGATGTAQNYDVGAQGAKVPLLAGFGGLSNVWSGVNIYTQVVTSQVGFKVGNKQVVSSQQAAIAAPSGGATIDTEGRAATALILAALRAHGLIAT